MGSAVLMAGKREFLTNLLLEAAGLFKGHWLCLAATASVFIVPVMLINAFFWGNPELVLKIINTISLNSFAVIDYGIYVILIVFFLLTLAALIRAIGTADGGGTPGVLSSYAQGLRILDSYLWVKFLFVFKVLCWSLLFVAPGIVFGVLYNFSGMAAAVDGKKGMEALRVSKKIIAQNISDYLYSVIITVTISVLGGAACIMSLDILLSFFALRGQHILARMIDVLEVGLIAAAGIYLLIFYYYLYKALRDRSRG
jgi:hypothetical protein